MPRARADRESMGSSQGGDFARVGAVGKISVAQSPAVTAAERKGRRLRAQQRVL